GGWEERWGGGTRGGGGGGGAGGGGGRAGLRGESPRRRAPPEGVRVEVSRPQRDPAAGAVRVRVGCVDEVDVRVRDAHVRARARAVRVSVDREQEVPEDRVPHRCGHGPPRVA